MERIKNKPEMQEELTTEMHAEFHCTEEDDLMHRCWDVLMLISYDTLEMVQANSESEEMQDLCTLYGVTPEQVLAEASDYFELRDSAPFDPETDEIVFED